MKISFAQTISATSIEPATDAQFLLTIACVLFALGLLFLILAQRLEARAATAAIKKAHRALRARLGA